MSKWSGVWRGFRCFLALLVVAAPTLVVVPDLRATPRVPVLGLTDTPPSDGGAVPTGEPLRVDLPAGTDSVGFTWSGPGATLAVRSLGAEGWSRWVTVGDEADHGDPTSSERRGAGPVWTGTAATAVEVVATGAAPVDLAVHASGPADGGRPDSAGATGVGGPAPGERRAVRPTTAWGSPGWSYANCPDGPAHTRPVEAVVVHHTATTTGYSAHEVDDVLRSIHRFHTRTRGWCDIAYQFLVDRFGRIWEGRTGGIALPVRGAHARGFNVATTGVALLGNYDTHGLPRAAADAVALLGAWKAAANDFHPAGRVQRTSGGSTSIPAGQRVVIDRISGHRDVSSSACPGRYAYGHLDALRGGAWQRLDPPSGFFFGGAAGDIQLAGDWTGGPGVGVYRNGTFRLRHDLAGGDADTVVRFGLPSDHPVAGDWNGDGVDTVGVERDGQFHLLDRNRTPSTPASVLGGRIVRPAVPPDFPVAAAVPVTGDWDGDGVDTVGYFAEGDLLLFADPAAQHIERRERIGRPGDVPMVADWEADGVDRVGLVRDRVVLAPATGHPHPLTAVHELPAGHTPFVVDWTGEGLPTLLTGTRRGYWDPTTPVGR